MDVMGPGFLTIRFVIFGRAVSSAISVAEREQTTPLVYKRYRWFFRSEKNGIRPVEETRSVAPVGLTLIHLKLVQHPLLEITDGWTRR